MNDFPRLKASDTITLIQLADLHESPFNPRKVFDQAALEELAADIKAHGIDSPLLVRRRVPPIFAGDPDAGIGYEIVFGHRRFRAAALAGLVEVPCMVKPLLDDEARRAQISENMQRLDIHPFEEAEGFQALITFDGMTAKSIAEQFGKSLAYVYARLKLLNACPAVRAAFLNGEIVSEIALLFARQTEALQMQALEKMKGNAFYKVRNGFEDGGKEGYRATRDFLNEFFMLDLKIAIFPLDDEGLVAAAGACTNCPKRSGFAPELFDDVIKHRTVHYSKGGEEICTDPDCFADKKKAQLKRAAAAIDAKAGPVITGGKARQIIGADGKVKAGYVEASTVRALIKKAKATIEIATIQNPRDGKTMQAVKIADLEAAGIALPRPKADSRQGYDYESMRAKRKVEDERQTKVNRITLQRVRAAASPSMFGSFELRTVALFMLEGAINSEARDPLLRLYETEKASDLVRMASQDMTPAQLSQLLLDCVLADGVDCSDSWNDPVMPDPLSNAAAHYGIDIAAIEAEITGELSTPGLAAAALNMPPAIAGEVATIAKKAKGKRGPVKLVDEDAPDDAGLIDDQSIDAGFAVGSDAQAELLTEGSDT